MNTSHLKPILLGACLLFSLPVFCQEDLHFRWLSTKDGLPSDTVYGVAEDHFGFRWLGTRNGLCRFDGHSFQNFPAQPGEVDSTKQSRKTLRHPTVGVLQTGSDGSLWLANNAGGLCRFEPATETFTYFPDVMAQLPEGQKKVSFLHLDARQKIWVNQHLIFDTKTLEFERASFPDSTLGLVGNVFGDSRGDTWFGTWMDTYSVVRRDGRTGKFQQWLVPDQTARNQPPQLIQRMMEDSRGDLWFSTYIGLVHLDRRTGKFWRYDAGNSGLKNSSVTDVLEDASGNL
ncbi:MAG: two-component regulator propeller domain-containing protein, partial [Bacteroidota bacterium]